MSATSRNERAHMFDEDWDPTKGFGKKAAGLGLLAIVLNFALLAGAIVVVVLVLRALGVIG